jgi:hypothetical protein
MLTRPWTAIATRHSVPGSSVNAVGQRWRIPFNSLLRALFAEFVSNCSRFGHCDREGLDHLVRSVMKS